MNEIGIMAEKKYRPNVAAVILSPSYPFSCDIFIARRNDMENVWQFPQGGIDDGESPKAALFRELKEEIGTNDIEVISEYPDWLSYDFPGHVCAKMYPFDGQTQKYFLVRLKSLKNINTNTKHPEFIDHKFIESSKIFDYIKHFKRPIYTKVIKYFKKEGFI